MKSGPSMFVYKILEGLYTTFFTHEISICRLHVSLQDCTFALTKFPLISKYAFEFTTERRDDVLSFLFGLNTYIMSYRVCGIVKVCLWYTGTYSSAWNSVVGLQTQQQTYENRSARQTIDENICTRSEKFNHYLYRAALFVFNSRQGLQSAKLPKGWSKIQNMLLV